MDIQEYINFAKTILSESDFEYCEELTVRKIKESEHVDIAPHPMYDKYLSEYLRSMIDSK